MQRLRRFACACLLLVLGAAAPAAPSFPPLTGRVVDAANVLTATDEAAIGTKLAQVEASSGRQLVVATIPDLGGYPIEDYGYQLGRAWGIGSKKLNDGVLLIIAPNDRKVRIEVGYGLEPILTDTLSSVIVQSAILPRFRAGDLPGGILAGVDQIAAQLALPPDQARARAQAAAAQQARSQKGDTGGGMLWTIFVIIVILFMLRGSFGGRRRRRGFPVIWGPGIGGGGGWGSGGGGFGGGGFGGGGFGGGGGSFGGGGSSGSW